MMAIFKAFAGSIFNLMLLAFISGGATGGGIVLLLIGHYVGALFSGMGCIAFAWAVNQIGKVKP